jgi:hypothetical protein
MPSIREQGLMLLALALVCLTNEVTPKQALEDKFRKQFMDHLLAHGVEKMRVRELHKLMQEELA